MMKNVKFWAAAALAVVMVSCGENQKKKAASNEEETAVQAGAVNVYSHRFYDTDKALFKQFEEETGIVVNVKMEDADRLLQLLQTEGENTPADLLITTDVGRLHYAKALGVLQPAITETLKNQVPSHLRDADDQWMGLTKRARVIMYNTSVVKPEELTTYEDLADPKWKGQISIRSSTNVYNKSLMASIIAHNGEEASLNWAKGVVANMVQEPKGNDRDQLKNIASGKGKLAVTNTYYLGIMLNSENELEKEAAQKVKPFFPNQDGRGAHINISGAGVVKHAKNKDNAIKLLEFLTSEKAQRAFSDANYEYPVNPAVEASDLLKSWGPFKEDTINLATVGENQVKAVEVFEKAGWK